jgi:hypothetical protein
MGQILLEQDLVDSDASSSCARSCPTRSSWAPPTCIDPAGADLQVRYRIDGRMADAAPIPGRQTARVISRINRRSPRSLASPRSPRSRR